MNQKEGAFKTGSLIAGRYQVLDYLGGGEITEVYKTKDLVGARIVALKISREPATKEIENQLNQEFFMLSRFNHPNIVAPFDFGITERKPFFTMEYFPGAPINKFFKGYSEDLLLVLIEILYALDTIHSQGLIHCDLKPQNILVNTAIDSDTGNKARAKLLDFGFANYFSSSNQIPRGTLGYIAPEIFKGTEADGRADLYSLGMVIYEILTGRGPSTETDLRNWLRTQYYSNFTPPSEIDSKIPEKFSNLCMRLLARDAFRRPISALEVIETISDIIPESLKEKIPTIGIRRSGEGVFSLQASSFIGRENELNILRNRLESAKGANGQLVFITGERGVGKSRLLQEFKFLAKLEGVSILQSAHTALGARPPSLIEDILANLSIYDGKDIKDIVAKQEDEATKYELFEEIIKKLKALANSSKIEHSLLLLIDNFELFDSMSLEFLRFLGFSIEKEKIFVVVSSLNERRILELSKEFLGKEFFQHITLGPLTQEETQLLVEAILGPHPSSAELSTWLFASTGGNPLFVIESLYSLLASKVIQLEYGRWRLDRNRLTSGDFKLPDTVYSLIKERLSTLTREELEVLKVGAITGTPFTVDFVRAVLGYEEHLLYSIFSRLRAINLLRPLPDSDGFVLSSKTLEAIITEGISVQERRDYHRSVALAIELLYPREQDRYLFDLAHHYTQAGIKDRAFNYCREAGAKAKRLNLTELALGFYETALALSSNFVSARERIELIEAVGRLREITGRFADAIDIYTQGLGILFSDNTLRREPNYVSLLASVLRRLGLIYQKQGKVDESISYFKQALTTLKEKDAVGTITLWNDIGWSLTAKGDFKKAEEFYSLALKTIDLKNSESLVDLKARTLYGMSALAWYKGEIDLALEYANRGLALYEKPAPAREEVESNWISSKSNLRGKIGQFLATIYWQKGELNKAKETYSSILSSPLWELSDVYFRIRTIQGLGLVDFETGDWHQALEYFKEAKELCEKIGDSAGLGDTLCNLGIILEEMGDWQKATAYYQKDIEIRQNIRDDNGLVIGLINLANLFTKKGDFIDAEPLLKEAENLTKQNKNQQILGQIYLAWAKLHLMRDQLDSAIKSLALALNVQRIYAKGNKQKLIEMLLTAAGIRAAEADWSKCLTTCERAQNLLTLPAAEGQAYNANLRLYSLLLRWRGLAKHALGFTDDGKEELNRSIEILRSLGAKYEMAKSLYYQAQANLLLLTAPKTYNQGEPLPITYKPLSEQELTRVLDDLKEAETIFTSLGAKVEQERVRYMLNHISQLEATHKLKGRERGEYLKVFYELSELINLDLEKEDFADRLLDLIIDVTQAERGLLFLIQGDKLFPVAARNVDHTTLEDAHTISRTVIRQVKKRAEPIICADALSDPRFVNSNSVVLNKIRSLVCVPLRIDDKVIGTIYLDSRINPNVFVEEDKNLLISVANLLAATIDRSFAFKKMQEDFSALREDILTDAVTGYFLGRSKAIKDVYSIIEQIAPTDCTVLLLGETGSGKGVLARLIHANSNRRANKFVSINCGTLPETLFESELFGHCKGAFTGAIRDKEGLFEIAEHGTIFMDEIANTSLSIQAKLLEVLEDKIIRRVGETEPRRVDVRLICATNKNLEEEVKANRFREDLYYRLNVVTIQVPPLRERKSDIMLLAGYFLKRYAKQLNKPILGFEDNIPQILTEYPWPGNVRELQNVIERAVIMAQKRKISLENLGPKIVNFAKTMKIEKGQKKSLEREQVIEALKATQGNVSRAAQMLSTHRRQIQRLLRRYNINKEDFQSS